MKEKLIAKGNKSNLIFNKSLDTDVNMIIEESKESDASLHNLRQRSETHKTESELI